MKNFRLIIQLVLLAFLLGKVATTVISMEISGLETTWATVPVDSSEEPVEEDDSTEEDDEFLNGLHRFHDSLVMSRIELTIYASHPLESPREVTVPPPQA